MGWPSAPVAGTASSRFGTKLTHSTVTHDVMTHMQRECETNERTDVSDFNISAKTRHSGHPTKTIRRDDLLSPSSPPHQAFSAKNFLNLSSHLYPFRKSPTTFLHQPFSPWKPLKNSLLVKRSQQLENDRGSRLCAGAPMSTRIRRACTRFSWLASCRRRARWRQRRQGGSIATELSIAAAPRSSAPVVGKQFRRSSPPVNVKGLSNCLSTTVLPPAIVFGVRCWSRRTRGNLLDLIRKSFPANLVPYPNISVVTNLRKKVALHKS